mgnify:FL=1
MIFFQATLFVILGVSLIFSGIAFINGQLAPHNFATAYDILHNIWLRTLVASMTFFFIANYAVSKAYMIGGQSITGPLYVVALIFGMIISALLIDKTSLNSHIIGGVFILMVGALWVVYGLSQS